MKRQQYILVLFVALCGCAHIDTDAVQICSDSLNVACIGNERLMSYSESIINDGTIYKHVNGTKFSDLVLIMGETTARDIDREHALARALNNDVMEFNNLLLKMASDDPIDKSYAYHTTSMDAHNKVLSRSFLFFANEYVMYRNFEAYQDAMINVNSNIVQYSDLMLAQTIMMRSDMWRQYTYICDTIGTLWGKSNKIVATRYMLAINKKVRAGDVLAAQLAEFYQELPLAYAELVDAKRVPIMWWKRNNYEHIFKLQKIAKNIKFTVTGR
jgi:hypothetical protein